MTIQVYQSKILSSKVTVKEVMLQLHSNLFCLCLLGCFRGKLVSREHKSSIFFMCHNSFSLLLILPDLIRVGSMTQEQRHQRLVTIGGGHMEGADIYLVSRVDTHLSRLRERDKYMTSGHNSDLRYSHLYFYIDKYRVSRFFKVE